MNRIAWLGLGGGAVDNLVDLGHGLTYALPQERLHPIGG